MKYFDTHAHYYDSKFLSLGIGGADELIDSLLETSVCGIINIGTSIDTSLDALNQAKKHKNMYTALGIHPSDAECSHESVDVAVAYIESLVKREDSKCVCIGEIGLDYHYPDYDKSYQKLFFDAQMTLASELDLPVCIHDRDSHEDVMKVIRSHPNVRGVLHSFSGSPEMARELVSRGYMISFSGTLTFTNARRPREVAAVLPHESVLIETDAPYLTPHPHRGKLNHSGYLEYTNRALAEVFGISEEGCAVLTESNAKRFFNIK